MNLLVVGTSFRKAPIELREKLALEGNRQSDVLQEINRRYDCEAVVVSTCNRVEIYQARAGAKVAPGPDLMDEFLAEYYQLGLGELQPYLYHHVQGDAVRHLFRVVSSLDSMVVGEGQIAGQVKRAYEFAQGQGTVGPALHILFQAAHGVAKRVRTETGIAKGHVSVSSVAVDYVRQVFDHFEDKTVLVIGAGKMGELTLKHLRQLEPKRILVTNRSPEKARTVAQGCGGEPVPWDCLDDALVSADIVLSTTGAPEPIMTRRRFNDILARRTGGTMVILDIAVPRDFDPRIHDGDRACLFNIDDLHKIRDETLKERQKHLVPAEKIVEQEVKRVQGDWKRRRHGPIIARLTRDMEAQRQVIVQQVLQRFGDKLSAGDREYLEGAFRLLQNRFLHGPISALADETSEAAPHSLLDALRKLFGLATDDPRDVDERKSK